MSRCINEVMGVLACGNDHIVNNDLRRETCTSRWFHMDYVVKEYFFILFHLKIDISSFL